MIEEILKYNKEFVASEQYRKYETSKYPDKKIAIVTCMDTRLVKLLPAALGLRNGDVKMIKNAGGTITNPFDSTMRSLLVAVYELGVEEIMIIGHTDCGAQHMDSKIMLQHIRAHGVTSEQLDMMEYCNIDLHAWLSGFDDVEKLGDFLQEDYTRHCVSVVIQAGGESRRMGRSKATVPFVGRPLICRLVERLSPVADELIITTNEAENLGFLYEMYPHAGIRLVADIHNERGALPGLYTALQAASNPYVAVVACDMVFASARLVVAEALAMHESGADVVTPHNKHGFEPLHAMYRRDTCAPVVHRRTETGEKRVQSFFSDPEITVLPFAQERVLEVEPRGGCFINANTPEDLARIEESYLGE